MCWYLHALYFGFPENCALALKYAGILYATYDFLSFKCSRLLLQLFLRIMHGVYNVKLINIWSFVQKRFYGEAMSPAKTKYT